MTSGPPRIHVTPTFSAPAWGAGSPHAVQGHAGMSVAQSEGSALLRMLGSPSQSRLVAGAGAAGGETLDFADPGLIHPFERLTVKSPQSRPAVVPHILVTGPQTAQAIAPPLSPSASPNPSPKRTHHGGRKAQAITNCPHKDRKHYAKGMCNNCYHAYGRKSKATLCPHFDRLNYAKGKCQLCYLNHYHREQRLKKKLKRKEEQDRLGDELKTRGGVGDGATDSTSFAWSPGQSPASSPAASPRSLSAFGSPNRSPSASPRSPRHAHHSLHHVRQVSASPQYCRSSSGQHLQPPSGSLFDWTSTGSPSSPSSAGSSPSLPPSPYRTAAPHPVMAGDLQPVYSPQVYGPGVYGGAEGLCAPADMFVPPPDFHGTMPGSPLGQRSVPAGDQGPVVAGCSPEQHRRARAIVRGMMAADDSVQRFQRQQHEQEQFLQQQELQQQQQQLQLQQQNQQQQQYHQQAATGQPSASLDPCADVFAFVAAPELPAELAGMNLSCAFCGAIAGTCCHQPAPQQHGGEVAPAPWETGLDMELQHAAAFEQNFGLGDMTEYESSLAGLLRDRCATDGTGGGDDSAGVHGPGMMTMEVTAPVPDAGPEGWLVRQLMLRSDSDDRMTQQLQSQPSAGWWQQLDGACGDLTLEG